MQKIKVLLATFVKRLVWSARSFVAHCRAFYLQLRCGPTTTSDDKATPVTPTFVAYSDELSQLVEACRPQPKSFLPIPYGTVDALTLIEFLRALPRSTDEAIEEQRMKLLMQARSCVARCAAERRRLDNKNDTAEYGA
jgi:hypothetical protein